MAIGIGVACVIGHNSSHGVNVAEKTQAIQLVANGIDGTGVSVVLLDTGIQANHSALAGKVVVFCKSAEKSCSDIAQNEDSEGHGTHIAGIIAGGDRDRPIGIAPGAKIISAKITSGEGVLYPAAISRGLIFAAQTDAFAVNLSLSSPTSALGAMKNGVMSAIEAGKLIIVAAGNLSSNEPGWPARYASNDWVKGQMLVVGAVDSNNEILPISNKAGSVKNRFLVAPGNGILSADAKSSHGLVPMSGTSMAAGVVSGAAMLVKQRWSNLTADDVANILLETATDLGEPGVDPVYGHGLLNIARAMQPIAPLSINKQGQVIDRFSRVFADLRPKKSPGLV